MGGLSKSLHSSAPTMNNRGTHYVISEEGRHSLPVQRATPANEKTHMQWRGRKAVKLEVPCEHPKIQEEEEEQQQSTESL